MKAFFFLALGLLADLYAQTQTQSKDWIDLSNKSDEAIIKILEREVAILAESPAEEASERLRLLQEQEKNAKQSFNQKNLLLEGEFTLAASAKETAEKAFADLQTDSTALSAQIDLYARSQQRLRERIDKFPFKAVVLAKAVYTGDLGIIKEKMIYEAGRLAIAQVNGVKLISETLVKNNILVSDIIEGTIEGKADCQPREWKALENGTRRVIYLYGVYDIYPLPEQVKAMIWHYDFYTRNVNPQGKCINNDFELQYNDKVIFDRATNLIWQRSGSPSYMPFYLAKDYIHQLNTEQLAGFNDWRLPTLEEAMSLMEPRQHGILYFDTIFDHKQDSIWTADKESSASAWNGVFIQGVCALSKVNHLRFVRAVRSAL